VQGSAGVLTSGNIVCDVLVRPVDDIAWGTSRWVDEIRRSLGGNGANTAYTIGRLGMTSRLVGLVGNDDAGEAALAALRGAGVDTGPIGRSRAPTSSTVALVNSRGERAFLHEPGSSREAFPAPLGFTPARIAGVTHYHLASPFALPLHRPHLAATLGRARAAGLSTSLDTQWDSRGRWMEDLAPALPLVDILFMNEEESRMLLGPREARALGVARVVLKCGGDGCAIYDAEGETHVPAFQVPVVDTTGAGDCFAGAFLFAALSGRSPIDSARFANGVAALSVQCLGAVEGLGPLDETERRIAQLAVSSG
ncbi:MAG: carbohydrate kinase family protein, partial [Bryobacteraceae bacterium]